MRNSISDIVEKAERFLELHCVANSYRAPLDGEFSLQQGSEKLDLYGTIDAVYILYAMGRLSERTDRSSRRVWAHRVLACQDDTGWFSRLNLRGHPHEHATAYAIGALRLLEVESDEQYVEQIKPLTPILPILTDHNRFRRWIERLGFRLSIPGLLRKNLGWHYIWRGSHIGGGVPASVGMLRSSLDLWWSDQVDLDEWFIWYFDWLDAHASANTGYWQRAFWNLVYDKPTLIDMGGAVHFLWIYEALDRPFPYPEQVIQSTLSLQRRDGLYGDHPFCIDLDGNFCLIRSYLQLSERRRQMYRDRVYRSVERNFEAIVKALAEKPQEEIYSDSHGLPGALAALVECVKLLDFKYADALAGWQHPLDKAWWL
jgi:hypothetical protein